MSHTAKRLRMGALRKAVLREGEEDADLVTVEHPLATGDDMTELINKVQTAAEMILRYENELLIAADVLLDKPQLRRDMMEFEEVTPDEAMLLLRSLLHWIKQLARAWPAPNLNTLMRSKGVLFLLAYVRMCEKRSPTSLCSGRRKKRSKQPSRDRLTLEHADTIAHIVLIYTGEEFKPDNLVDKLQDFRRKYPTIHRRMVSLLKRLEEVARAKPRGVVPIHSWIHT
jgi:hypothetical protein